MKFKVCLLLLASTAWTASPGAAAEARLLTPDTVALPALHVNEEHYDVPNPIPVDVEGAKINSGKKITLLDLNALPRITGNNYRQALIQTPGLLLTEETSPLVSIGYRGLDPYRAQYTQVLKDGIPIHADQFGYPEAYYTPALDSVQGIEFVRGGAGLRYGPQPGGALNYVTRDPRSDSGLSGETLHTFGSDNYYASFTDVDARAGPVGFYGYFQHREADGIRSANSSYKIDAWVGLVALNLESLGQAQLTFEAYDEGHGEPGGLTFADVPGAARYDLDRRAPSRLYDRFSLDRKAVTLTWAKSFDSGFVLEARAWYIDYLRSSYRQRGGGFGVLPSGPLANSNVIEVKHFMNGGADLRARYDWGRNNTHVFTAGGQVYRGHSPLAERVGEVPWASDGEYRFKSTRDILYTPVHVENLFSFGRFKVTPGFRAEIMHQRIEEKLNVAKTAAGNPLSLRKDNSVVPIAGLGATWDVSSIGQFYVNVSESYRPPLFTEVMPQGGTTLAFEDLKPGHARQYEIGYRGQFRSGVAVDASVFQMDFKNQFGEVALPGGYSTIMNVGRSVHNGAELSVDYNVLSRWARPRLGSLRVFANAMLLDAEFRSGKFAGNSPQHAPGHLVRVGVVYQNRERVKIGLTGTLSSDTFGDDGNLAERRIPAYAVWDFTTEFAVAYLPVRVMAGINNVFDEDYYTRAKNEGIDPSSPRTYYFGGSVRF